MKFLLDTGNIEHIKKYSDYIVGVTTNPIILKRENKTIKEFYEDVKYLIDVVFVQISSEHDVFSNENNNVVYKIPIIPSMFSLIKYLIKNKGLQVCATTTYDIIQFQRACDMGCQYSIVLCHKNDDKSFLYKCNLIKDKYNYDTKIIAASFREKSEVEDVILIGTDYITLRPETLEKCMINKFANMDILEYNKNSGD